MNNERFALAGLACCAIGLVLGITLSSAIPNTPFVFGLTIAGYAAVTAAVTGGIKRKKAGT